MFDWLDRICLFSSWRVLRLIKTLLGCPFDWFHGWFAICCPACKLIFLDWWLPIVANSARIEPFILIVTSIDAASELRCWRLHKKDIRTLLDVTLCYNTVFFWDDCQITWMISLVFNDAFSLLSFDLLSARALIVLIGDILFFSR